MKKVDCKQCGKNVPVSGRYGLSVHVLKEHNLSPEGYFNKFSSKEPCVVCGSDTKFISLIKGYKKTCGVNCTAKYRMPSGGYHKYDTIMIEKIIPEYMLGASKSSLSKKYDIKFDTLTTYFKRHNVKVRSLSESASIRKREYKHKDICKLVAEDYKLGLTGNEIALKYSIPVSHIASIAKRGGAVDRSKEELADIQKAHSKAYLRKTHIEKSKIIEAYKHVTGSVNSLSIKFKTSTRVISRLLSEYGIKLKSTDELLKAKNLNTISTNQERYGVDHTAQIPEVTNKTKHTFNKNYGNSCYFKTDDYKSKKDITIKNNWDGVIPVRHQSVKDKTKATNQKRHGVDSILMDKKKMREGMQRVHGVDHPMHSKEILDRVISTNIAKYGSKSFLGSKSMEPHRKKRTKSIFAIKSARLEVELSNWGYTLIDEYNGIFNKHNSKHKQYKIKCHKCNSIFLDDVFEIPYCKKCNTRGCSQAELSIRYLMEQHTTVNPSVKNIIKINRWSELDMVLPDHNIAVEYNGNYWHSSACGKAVNYHTRKTELCLEKGIDLIHVWEHHDLDKVKARLLSKVIGNRFNMGARECTVSLKENTKEFFNNNHLDSSVGNLFSVSLVHNNEIVCAISFRKHSEGLEIARFATKLNHSVHHGFSRLMKYGKIEARKRGFNKIITYADIDWTPDYEKSVYFSYGMSYLGATQERLYYTKGRNVYTRQKFQKHKLKEMFPDSYSDEKTANEILEENGIYSIYKTGNHKFTLNI